MAQIRWNDAGWQGPRRRRSAARDGGSDRLVLYACLCSDRHSRGQSGRHCEPSEHDVDAGWAFLVFGMQVGFTMLEAGFCRSRETVNVLVECVVDTCLCGI